MSSIILSKNANINDAKLSITYRKHLRTKYLFECEHNAERISK
jgi:hypothetical protein